MPLKCDRITDRGAAAVEKGRVNRMNAVAPRDGNSIGRRCLVGQLLTGYQFLQDLLGSLEPFFNPGPVQLSPQAPVCLQRLNDFILGVLPLSYSKAPV